FAFGLCKSPPGAHAPSRSPVSKQSRVDTRERQDADPVPARVLPTACRAESRPTPAETAKRHRTSKRLLIDSIRLGEALEIGKQGAKRYQIFEVAARGSDSATRREHCIELHTGCLIDR